MRDGHLDDITLTLLVYSTSFLLVVRYEVWAS